MAVGIVHHFEPVEIDKQDRKVPLLEKHAAGAGNRLPQPVEKERPVRQPGQRVMGGVEADDLLGLLAVGDIARDSIGAEGAAAAWGCRRWDRHRSPSR